MTRSSRNYAAVWRRDQGTCQYCGEPAESIDHVRPWSWRQDNRMANLVAACLPCNLKASDLIFPDFPEKRRFIREQRKLDIRPEPKQITPYRELSPIVTVIDAIWEEVPESPQTGQCGHPTVKGHPCRVTHPCYVHMPR